QKIANVQRLMFNYHLSCPIGGTDEFRETTLDNWSAHACCRHALQFIAGTWPGWSSRKTVDGRGRLQKRSSAEGNSRQSVYGDDGVLLRGFGLQLHELPRRCGPRQ